jgi:hypothetical protein
MFPASTSFTRNLTWSHPALNSRPRGKKRAPIRLNYGTANEVKMNNEFQYYV